jgi:hypothetical protein
MKTKAQPTRKPRKPRKLHPVKVLELHGKGLNTVEIAQHQGVAPSTVWRFLQQTEPERQAVEQFKENRADVLARLQAKSLDAQERIVDSLDDGVVAALTPSQKSGLLMSLNAQSGTAFDKERLQRGQSTENVSVIERMLAQSHEDIFKPRLSKRAQASDVQPQACIDVTPPASTSSETEQEGEA